MLTATDARETLWATDAAAEMLEDLQFTLNEGACLQAAMTGSPVLVPDLWQHQPAGHDVAGDVVEPPPLRVTPVRGRS